MHTFVYMYIQTNKQKRKKKENKNKKITRIPTCVSLKIFRN